MQLRLAALSMAAAALLPGCAWAAQDWGVFSAVMLASDYRYQGVSESRGHAVMQGYAHWQDRAGYFVGVFATQVDFGYSSAPSYELDIYAGKNLEFDHGRTELKLEAMASSYPDNRTPGPTLDFVQLSSQLKHIAGPWTVIGVAAYTPQGSYGSGPVRRIEGEVDYAAAPDLTVKTLLGNQGGGRGHERTYFSLSAVKTWKNVSVELRYVVTDRSRYDCGFQPTACDPGLVGVLTVALPPIP
jgi:uncharacterized protein (TIGR02001 family)